LDWSFALLILIGSLLLIMTSGLPIAFCFLLVNIIGALLFWGGAAGLEQLAASVVDSVITFTLVPVPLFVLMGELMFHSGIGTLLMNALDNLIGKVPGRLSLLAVAGGTVLSTLTGVPMGSIAVLGSVLLPEMERRGYKKSMSLGPIMASGGLAILIPPSALAVMMGGIGQIVISKLLIAIIMPGILLACLFATYIIVRCTLQPSIAPAYDVPAISWKDRFVSVVVYILPVGLVIFFCIGVIILGITTPSEAAATGVLGTVILVAIYRKLTWKAIKTSMISTVQITVMMFMIVAGAKAFGSNLAFTGASQGLTDLIISIPVPGIFTMVLMQVIIMIAGTFMEAVSMMMVTIPLFLPVVHAMGFDPVWFGTVFLLNMELAGISPPVGMYLFIMKGVAPPDTKMADIYRSGIPFCLIDIICMALVMAFPQIALWLPGLIRKQ
jgi:tripartite ATP-independent transporter DctM subunit